MSRPVRLLVTSAYTDLGGGETSLLSTLTSLDRRRVHALLLTRAEGQLSAAARARGLDVDILPYRGASIWFVPGIWERMPAAKRLAARIRALAVDVVCTDFHTLPYAAAGCRAAGIPLIFFCWGWWFRPRHWQRTFYRTRVHTIVAGSEAVKRGFLGPAPVVDPDTIPVIHPGVDAERFRPRPADVASIRRELVLPSAGPLVTLIARFQHVKGHDIFLAAARQVLEAWPDATFAMAGEHIFGQSADAAFKRRILATAQRDPVLQSRVRFLGWCSDPERLLAASDVVVCSSRFETFGMVAVEAMSCGVPVVSVDVGGPRETIVDGVTGHLVPPERPDLIASRICALLNDDATRQSMGAAGRAHVVACFSLEQNARHLERVIARVVER